MELNDWVDFGQTIKPICMPHWGTRPYNNDAAVIAGWGKEGRNWRSNLKEVGVEIWSQEFCSRIMPEAEKLWYSPWHTITK